MTNILNSLTAFAATSILSVSFAFAGSPLEGAFKGESKATMGAFNHDVMALLLRTDPNQIDSYFAVLAEYTRRTGTISPEKLALTSWVPRMYAYHVEKINDLVYAMKPLAVSEAGEIVVNDDLKADVLSLKKPHSLIGATLTRYKRNTFLNSQEIVETINFNDQAVSTWEDYVAGGFFQSKDNTGGDYFKKDINTVFTAEGIANFFQKDVSGEFYVSERVSGMYTLSPKRRDNVGNERVTGKIGVFIDIVNWKSFGIDKFTTEEFLLINPDDPADVGFFYERH